MGHGSTMANCECHNQAGYHFSGTIPESSLKIRKQADRVFVGFGGGFGVAWATGDENGIKETNTSTKHLLFFQVLPLFFISGGLPSGKLT